MKDDTKARIAELLAEADSVDQEYKRVTGPLRERMDAIQEELNTFRTKCPTCRCKLLPEEVCRCCAGREDIINHLKDLARENGADVEVLSMDMDEDARPDPKAN